MEKKYSFNKNKIDVEYSITNGGENELLTVFGSECNLSFAAKGMESHRVYNTSKQKTFELGIDFTTVRDVKEISIDDVTNNVSIKMEIDKPAELWILPIETNSLGEAGIETIYQSTCFIPRWELKLGPGESWRNSISFIFTESN